MGRCIRVGVNLAGFVLALSPLWLTGCGGGSDGAGSETSGSGSTVTYATDLNTGTTIELRNHDGGTTITNVATGESVEDVRELRLTNEQYTAMQESARAEEKTALSAQNTGSLSIIEKATTCGEYYLTIYSSSATFPSCYLGSQPVQISVKFRSRTYYSPWTFSATLYRKTIFFDANLGTVPVSIGNGYFLQQTAKWTTSSNGNFYVKISKNYGKTDEVYVTYSQ
jgi:hypothetical protein